METITQRFKLKDIFPEKAKEIAKRYHRKADEIEFIRKGVTPSEVKAAPEENAIISYITTKTKDRDNEIVDPEGAILADYRKNPVVLWGHNYTARELPLGKNLWIKQDEKGLIAKTQYYVKDDFARKVYEYRKDGFPLAESIGFIPLDWEDFDEKKAADNDGARRKYNKWLLLEYSDVVVPSNPDAIAIAMKQGLVTEEQAEELQVELPEDDEIEIDDVVEEEEAKAVTEDNSEADDLANLPAEKINVDREWEAQKEVITKPEETDEYIRIPVNECEITATIDISKEKGIKALYCGKVKKVATYLFLKSKGWTMESAKEWIKEHKDIEMYEVKMEKPNYKERWNKSLSKNFDVEIGEETPTTFEYNVFKKFLNCEVRNIFQNNYTIPSPLLGTYLAGFKSILSKFKLIETRNFVGYNGIEIPPVSEVIQLNSTDSDDFLIDGIQFYKADNNPLIIKISPSWFGINISIVTSNNNKKWNKELLNQVHKWVKENNYLKGEKFALNGEFIEKSEDDWQDIFLDPNIKESVQKSVNTLSKQIKDINSRGLLFVGVPGTGKTKTGRILLNKVESTFIWVSSKDMGRAGHSALSLAFDLARDLAPTILFIEDIDTWLRDYAIDLLKTELDGIKQNKGIVTILTSNSPDKLPDALLDRPGRFHHVLNFALPDKENRKNMIVSWTENIDKKLLEEIVDKTENFSGAHIKELIDFAKIIVEEDEIDIGEALLESLERIIAQRELINEIRNNSVSSKGISPLLHLKTGAVLNSKNKSNLKQAQALIQTVLDSAEPAEEAKQEYNCECIECGYSMKSDKHCKDIKCPKCGGEMRRAERPGEGTRSIDDSNDLDFELIDDDEIEVELPETLPEKEEPKEPEFDDVFLKDLITDITKELSNDNGNSDKLFDKAKENMEIERKKALGKVL